MAARRTTGGRPQKVVILSGGSGRTGRQVLQAALAQFEHPLVEIVTRPRVRSVKTALKVIESARAQRALVCHTLVQPDVREAVSQACQRHSVDCVDLLGPTLALLEDHLDHAPQNRPGLAYELNKEQFARIDAVDFTLAHDDGQRVKDLKQADVVLVGASRVSKSVTCFYLAYRGIRAANIPLLLVTPPPEELFELDRHKVIGLTMNAHRLQHLREARGGAIGAANLGDYTDLRHIAKELRYAQALMSEHGWRSIDVSYKAVEEVAGEIIELLEVRSPAGGKGCREPKVLTDLYPTPRAELTR